MSVAAIAPIAPKVSVIIPLYYAEDYVDELLSQLRTQPLEDIEIICVSDGSPDASLDIAKRHAEDDERVIALWQEHAGAGVARNTGIEQARGEYLAFLDVDDLYAELFLSKMYETAAVNDADLVVCQHSLVDFREHISTPDIGFRKAQIPVQKVFSPEDIPSSFAGISGGPTNKLFRRSMIERESLQFSDTQSTNDIFFVRAAIASSKRIVALPDSLIQVRRHTNPNSISSGRGAYAEDFVKAYRQLYSWLEEHCLQERFGSSYMDAWAGGLHYSASFHNLNSPLEEDRFVALVVHTLVCEEPWRSLSDKQLASAARLDVGVARIKQFALGRDRSTPAKSAAARRLDNEVATISSIVDVLNTEYGRHLPQARSLPASVVSYAMKNGVRGSVSKFMSYVRARMPQRSS